MYVITSLSCLVSYTITTASYACMTTLLHVHVHVHLHVHVHDNVNLMWLRVSGLSQHQEEQLLQEKASLLAVNSFR